MQTSLEIVLPEQCLVVWIPVFYQWKDLEMIEKRLHLGHDLVEMAMHFLEAVLVLQAYSAVAAVVVAAVAFVAVAAVGNPASLHCLLGHLVDMIVPKTCMACEMELHCLVHHFVDFLFLMTTDYHPRASMP
jgi:hypothetical protein